MIELVNIHSLFARIAVLDVSKNWPLSIDCEAEIRGRGDREGSKGKNPASRVVSSTARGGVIPHEDDEYDRSTAG